MKCSRDSDILNDLTEQLEEILNKVKESDLCHLIKPIEDTIFKVKELNRGRKVECEYTCECNSDAGDLQMACSCNDWGPDTLGPDGKWICELCGGNCSCDDIWDSRINIPKENITKKAVCETNKKEENLCKLFQADASVKCDSCICGLTRKNEIITSFNSPTVSKTKLSPSICNSSQKIENEGRKNKKTLIPKAVSRMKHKSCNGSPSKKIKKRTSKKALIPSEPSRTKCNPCACGASKKIENKTRASKQALIPSASSRTTLIPCVSVSSKKIESEDRMSNKKKTLVSPAASRFKFNPCICTIDHLAIHFKSLECTSVSKDTEFNKNSRVKPSKKDVSVLYDPRFCSSIKKVESEGQVLNSEDLITDKSQIKLSCKEIQIRNSRTREAVCAKRHKCKNCKCTYDEKGNKIKTEECRAASDRRKKLMASLEKEKNATKFEDCENKEVDSEFRKSVEMKISHSASNFTCYGKQNSKVLIFAKKGKCGIVECKSSSIELLSSWRDSKDLKCREGIKAKNEERRAQQISKYASSRSDQSLKKPCSEFQAERKQTELEKPEKPLKCSEMAGRKTIEKSVGPNENMESRVHSCNKCSCSGQEHKSAEEFSVLKPENVKEKFHEPKIAEFRPDKNLRRKQPLCNKCPPPVRNFTSAIQSSTDWSENVETQCESLEKSSTHSEITESKTDQNSQCSPSDRSEKVKKERETLTKSNNCTETAKRIVAQRRDGPLMQKPTRGTLRRQRLQAEKLQAEKLQAEKLQAEKFQAEKMQCSSDDQQKKINGKIEGKILDRNFQKGNYCNPATSIEKLCPCGCGYFIEGVSATRPCSCSLKSPRQEDSEFKKPVSRLRKCDCEDNCDWCSKISNSK